MVCVCVDSRLAVVVAVLLRDWLQSKPSQVCLVAETTPRHEQNGDRCVDRRPLNWALAQCTLVVCLLLWNCRVRQATARRPAGRAGDELVYTNCDKCLVCLNWTWSMLWPNSAHGVAILGHVVAELSRVVAVVRCCSGCWVCRHSLSLWTLYISE